MCVAGAGSLLLEFGVLSRLLNDPTYEFLARRTNRALWNARDNETGLLGEEEDYYLFVVIIRQLICNVSCKNETQSII
jgi:hypothetical protein